MLARSLKRVAVVALVAPVVAFSGAVAHEHEAPAGEGYVFDKTHTHILFQISHLGFSTTHGRFNDFDGTVVFDPDAPENTEIDVAVKIESINTGVADLDEHLMDDRFFNVSEHPEMTFKSTGITLTGDETATLTGDLTLLGVTKPVTFDVKLNGAGEHPFREGVMVAGFDATGTITRSEFGMTYGVPAIGDEVKVVLSTEFLKSADE